MVELALLSLEELVLVAAFVAWRSPSTNLLVEDEGQAGGRAAEGALELLGQYLGGLRRELAELVDAAAAGAVSGEPRAAVVVVAGGRYGPNG